LCTTIVSFLSLHAALRILVAVTVIYAISIVLAAIGGNALMTATRIMQGIATAVMIVIVAILAWRYVKSKPTVWKVLYIICLLIVDRKSTRLNSSHVSISYA